MRLQPGVRRRKRGRSSGDVMKQNLLGYGLPASQVDDILGLFAAFGAGYASLVTADVADVTGRQPRSLATFVHD